MILWRRFWTTTGVGVPTEENSKDDICVCCNGEMQGKDSPTFNVDGIDANVTDACQKMSTKSINYASMNR